METTTAKESNRFLIKPHALAGFYLDAPNPVQGGLQLDEQTGRSKDQGDDSDGGGN